MSARLPGVAPSPPSLARYGRQSAVKDLRFRAFGQRVEDLEVDFSVNPRPIVETRILVCCAMDRGGRRVDEKFCWGLEVGERIEALLTIVALGGTSELSISMRCPNAACRQPMETELTMKEILDIQRRAEASEPEALVLGGASFPLRQPTGADQLSWLEGSYPDEAAVTRAMVETMVAPEQRDEFRKASQTAGWLPAAESALDAQDPLVALTLEVRCPDCATTVRHALDLAGIALDRLRDEQRRLLMTVHRLASRYHWSEAEFFQVSPWRRARYLALLDQEGS